MKHTKGPWKLHDTKQIIAWDNVAQESSTICFIGSGDTTENEDIQNAALIAAAPEMFEVLQLIGTIANVGLETDSDYKNRMLRISRHATEIIKKAKGE